MELPDRFFHAILGRVVKNMRLGELNKGKIRSTKDGWAIYVAIDKIKHNKSGIHIHVTDDNSIEAEV